MTEIKRYEMEKEYSLDINVNPVEEHDGSFVRYDDHAAIVAALQEQVRALAAESARCKFEISRCHQTVDEMFKNREKWIDKEWLSSIWSTSKRLMDETPATDAVIREIRAQAVEEYAATVGAVKNGAIYANSIRSGEQP